MAAILDRQHTGKSATDTQLGAWADLDGDGEQDPEEREAMLTPQYLWHAELELRKLEHIVIPMSDGSYSDRHARAIRYARQRPSDRFAYMAAHLNASSDAPSNCGAVFYDARSSGGKQLAEHIRDALAEACPALVQVRGLDRERLFDDQRHLLRPTESLGDRLRALFRQRTQSPRPAATRGPGAPGARAGRGNRPLGALNTRGRHAE